MAEVAEVKHCSNPGCDQPGIYKCSACKTTLYCDPICQTADWSHHKEECPGHLRKIGNANLDKAECFHDEQNRVQTLRCGEIAATKLKQLKDRRLETVQLIDKALACKFDALQRLNRNREAKECAEERYTLWAMNQMRNPGSINAALFLIQSCLHNEEYEDAERYARHAMFMINDRTDNLIPVDQRPRFLAKGSYLLSQALFQLARTGSIPPAQQQKAGEEAITLARQALELHIEVRGTESADVAGDMSLLATALGYFNDVDDNEILRLREQSIAIYRRVEGSSSVNVAVGEESLGNVYNSRAKRAHDANDLDRCLANLELALPHFCEAARIFRVNNRVGSADGTLRNIALVEDKIRQIRIARASAAAPAIAATTRG